MLIYVFSVHIFSWVNLALLMFSLSPIVLVWLAVRILKDGEASTKTFSDGFWYDDMPRQTEAQKS
ncbi:MAG: hypothetical protein EAZ55_00785 [Cytophagales bacterium]|nr:MAG: hypothetical protein EAZ55_00785 [Cytophagales bacterium]